jgi:GH24 family phage-related lysozyme (muramidase)
MTSSAIIQAAGLVIQTEGFVPGIYRDSKGIATIGNGIALITGSPGAYSALSESDLEGILGAAGITLNGDQLNQLSAYLSANAAVVNGQAPTSAQTALNNAIPQYGKNFSDPQGS